jgi:hypothetical protein
MNQGLLMCKIVNYAFLWREDSIKVQNSYVYGYENINHVNHTPLLGLLNFLLKFKAFLQPNKL